MSFVRVLDTINLIGINYQLFSSIYVYTPIYSTEKILKPDLSWMTEKLKEKIYKKRD